MECYSKGGRDTLKTLTSLGRRRRLTPRQAEEFVELVKQGPDLHEHGVVRWRCEDPVKVLADRFAVTDVHPSTASKWLNNASLARDYTTRKRTQQRRGRLKQGFKDKVKAALPAAVKGKL